MTTAGHSSVQVSGKSIMSGVDILRIPISEWTELQARFLQAARLYRTLETLHDRAGKAIMDRLRGRGGKLKALACNPNRLIDWINKQIRIDARAAADKAREEQGGVRWNYTMRGGKAIR